MVCIPCIVLPVLLFIWHRFLYPIVKKFWDPFGTPKKIEGSKDSDNANESKTDLVDSTSNGPKCPFTSSDKLNTIEGEINSQDSKKDNEEEKNESETPEQILTFAKPLEQVNLKHSLNQIEANMEEFPTTLEGFCYKFQDGKLRHISTGKPFTFVVKEDDLSYNQKHYEALGAVVTEEVYNLLEESCGLKRIVVPIDAKESEATGFIFASKDYAEKEKLLVLIHGSGRVRAGQWAQRLIINDCLDSGTQIPFIERGLKEGFGILVLNTNLNTSKVNERSKLIRGNENPMDHGEYVWKNFIQNGISKRICIVAHSFGGIVTTKLFSRCKRDFTDRVVAIAMTDSVHFIQDATQYKRLIEVSCNWVVSDQPLDTPISKRGNDVPCVSAGCQQHEYTSWSSFGSIFRFFSEKLDLADALESKAPECKKQKLLIEGLSPPSTAEEPVAKDSQMSFQEGDEEEGGPAADHQISSSGTSSSDSQEVL